jgi:photosystem II stability/assembly factor-like uncharacterized protein
MANPIQAFVGTYVGGGGCSASGFLTFSFANTGGFDAYLPVTITNPGTTSISAGAEVTVYRTTDGGTNWETVGTVGVVFPKSTTASQVQRRDLYLSTGQYLVAVMVGGGNSSTFTAQIGTAWVISAYA